MQNNNSIRNLIITIILMFVYQFSGIYLSLLLHPSHNFYLLPYLQILILFLPVWFLSGNNFETRIENLGLEKIEYDTKVVFMLLITAILFQLFYNSLNTIIDKLCEGTYLVNFVNLRKLKSRTIAWFFMDRSVINIIYGTIAIAIIPAIVEEIVFRGFLLKSYLIENKYKSAIVIPALVFAFVHFNPLDFSSLFLLSLILAYLAIKTKTIKYSIIFHFFINFSVVVYYSMIPEIKPENKQVLNDFGTSILIAVITGFLVIILLKKVIQLVNYHQDQTSI